MKLFIIIYILSTSLFGQNVFGFVSKVRGEAYETTQAQSTIQLQVGDEVRVNSTVYTKEKSRLIIKFEKDIIVLNQNCKLILDEKKSVTQESGSIFYNVEPAKSFTKVVKKLAQNKFKVKTKNATIGIRGTDFIVNSDIDQKVFLRNGKLNIASVNEKFKMFKKQENEFDSFEKAQEDEFNDFEKEQEDKLNKIEDDFDDFAEKQEYEFSSYEKEFTLEHNKYVYIKDGEVYQEEFSKEVDSMFEELDMFISE